MYGVTDTDISGTYLYQIRNVQRMYAFDEELFVKDDKVVASVCGYAENLGYRVDFSDSVTYDDKAVFSVDGVHYSS